jgi:hypothetical protein
MLRRLTLRELAATPEGEALAAQLISVLNTEHLSAPGGPRRCMLKHSHNHADCVTRQPIM